MLTNRIPLNALQTALYETLATYQTTPIWDDVPQTAPLPYITLGSVTVKPNGAKMVDISDLTVQIHIFSSYEGKFEVNSITDDIINVLAAVQLDLTKNQFIVLEQSIDMIECFPVDEGNGYMGVLTLATKIQNIKQS